MLADRGRRHVPHPDDWEPGCYNETMAGVANRQVTARLAADPSLRWFGLEGGHVYAARSRREAEALHGTRFRPDRTWF